MNPNPVPVYQGEPILDTSPRPAFRISPEEIVLSIRQQFAERELAFRELGQNAADAGATAIRVDFRYEEGFLVADFLDNGHGMTDEVIRKHYLRLFDSSKEDQANMVGSFSLGRLSAFCYDLDRLEILTLPPAGPGYEVVILSDMSGRYYRIERESAAGLLGGPHGTRVRMVVRAGSPEAFVNMVQKADESMEKELCWIAPALTVTTALIEEGEIGYDSCRLNRPMDIPGKLGARLTVRLASGAGEARIFLGLDNPADNPASALRRYDASRQAYLAPVTLCIGKIPVERPARLPWTGRKPFALKGLRVIIDSFQFKTNIGRNVVYPDDPFMRELLPKLFHEIILGRFVKGLARLFSRASFRLPHYEAVTRQLLADVCAQSAEHGFGIPGEVGEAPFILSFTSFVPYSLNDLDGVKGPIYYTYAEPSPVSLREMDRNPSGFACVSIGGLPYDFKIFLENRYRERFSWKETMFVLKDEDSPEMKQLAQAIEKRIDFRRLWRKIRSAAPEGNSLPNAGRLTVGRFLQFDGRPETSTPVFYAGKPSPRLCLNHDHPHIRSLIDLLLDPGGMQSDVAAHFLARELVFEPGLPLSMGQREHVLDGDLMNRFDVSSWLNIRKPREEKGDDAGDDDEFFLSLVSEMLGDRHVVI